MFTLVSHFLNHYHVNTSTIFLDFSREIVYISMSYLDRYLSTRTVNRRVFQLSAMTALYIATKLFEKGRLGVLRITELSRGYFTVENIAAMEEIMLQTLNWFVHPPTPMAFCRDLMRLTSGVITSPKIRCEIHELVRYLTELSVCDYWFVTCKPSTIAIASFMCAFDLQGCQRIDSRCKEDFFQKIEGFGFDSVTNEDTEKCCERLRGIFISRRNATDDDEAAEESGGSRVAVVTPAGELDEPGDQCAVRAESPKSVVMSQSPSRKRKSVCSNFKANDLTKMDCA